MDAGLIAKHNIYQYETKKIEDEDCNLGHAWRPCKLRRI
jgi:hypothetical protein